MGVPGAGDRIRHEVSSWPDVTVAPHRFGGVEFRVGRRELGHVHGDRLADLPFPIVVRTELVAAGRAQPHHILPESGWVSYRMRAPEDAAGAIALFRLNYDQPWRRRNRLDEVVDEASDESFPASDPPAFVPVTGVGHISADED